MSCAKPIIILNWDDLFWQQRVERDCVYWGIGESLSESAGPFHTNQILCGNELEEILLWGQSVEMYFICTNVKIQRIIQILVPMNTYNLIIWNISFNHFSTYLYKDVKIQLRPRIEFIRFLIFVLHINKKKKNSRKIPNQGVVTCISHS